LLLAAAPTPFCVTSSGELRSSDLSVVKLVLVWKRRARVPFAARSIRLLREPLDLQVCHGELDGRSSTALTRWMTEHLRLAVHVSQDRDSLAGLEHAVLARLDPPLNLDGMTPTSLRASLTARRKALLAPPGQLT
jgi:hypothetical protein